MTLADITMATFFVKWAHDDYEFSHIIQVIVNKYPKCKLWVEIMFKDF